MLNPGDIITCENGHPICEVVVPIKAETMNWHRCLGNFRGQEPVPGTKIKAIRCDCGAEWVRSAVDSNTIRAVGFGLHVEGRGWVPEAASEWKRKDDTNGRIN